MTETTFKLSSPLKTHAGLVAQLKLKPPKARLLVNHGDPFKIQAIKNEAGEVEGHEYAFNNKAMIEVAADMTGVDSIALSDLSVSDFMRLRRAITDLNIGGRGRQKPFRAARHLNGLADQGQSSRRG